MNIDYNSVAIGEPERWVCKASHCGNKQKQRSHAMLTHYCLFMPHTPRCYF